MVAIILAELRVSGPFLPPSTTGCAWGGGPLAHLACSPFLPALSVLPFSHSSPALVHQRYKVIVQPILWALWWVAGRQAFQALTTILRSPEGHS